MAAYFFGEGGAFEPWESPSLLEYDHGLEGGGHRIAYSPPRSGKVFKFECLTVKKKLHQAPQIVPPALPPGPSFPVLLFQRFAWHAISHPRSRSPASVSCPGHTAFRLRRDGRQGYARRRTQRSRHARSFAVTNGSVNNTHTHTHRCKKYTCKIWLPNRLDAKRLGTLTATAVSCKSSLARPIVVPRPVRTSHTHTGASGLAKRTSESGFTRKPRSVPAPVFMSPVLR